MQLSLADQTVLVTGGGSGIGKGVATAAAASGAKVMLVGRNADKLAAAADEIGPLARDGGAVLYEPADVTNEDEVSRVVEAATAWTGTLHGVVHCAGGSETIGPVTQIDSEAWRRTVDLNINGTMYVLKHAAREMVRGGGGSFVGISSIAASNTHRWFGAYGVSKAGIDHLMQLGRRRTRAVLGARQLHPARSDSHRTRCAGAGFAGAERRLRGHHAAAAASARSPTSRTRRSSCSAMPPVTSRARSSTSTAAFWCGAARTTRRCWSRSSVPTGCAGWCRASDRSGRFHRPPMRPARRPPTSRGLRRRGRAA